MTIELGKVYQDPATQDRLRCAELHADTVVFSLLDKNDQVSHVEFRIYALSNAVLGTLTDVTGPNQKYRWAKGVVLHDTLAGGNTTNQLKRIRITLTPEESYLPPNQYYGLYKYQEAISSDANEGMVVANSFDDQTYQQGVTLFRYRPIEMDGGSDDYIVVKKALIPQF